MGGNINITTICDNKNELPIAIEIKKEDLTPEEYFLMMDYVYNKDFNYFFEEMIKGSTDWPNNEEKKQAFEQESNRRKEEWIKRNKFCNISDK